MAAMVVVVVEVDVVDGKVKLGVTGTDVGGVVARVVVDDLNVVVVRRDSVVDVVRNVIVGEVLVVVGPATSPVLEPS